MLATVDQIEAAIRRVLPQLRALGVESVSLFGSAARGNLGQASDLDVLVTFAADAHVTLLTLARVANTLEDATGRSIDLLEDHPRLDPEFRREIARDLRRVA